MGTIRKVALALAGLLLAACVAVAMGTWAYPEERDLIAERSGFRLSVTGIGAGLSCLTLLGFAALRRKAGGGKGAGDALNGLGFGLLPAAAVWKIFEQRTRTGQGREIPEGLPRLPWISEGGAAQPCRIELILALLLFAAILLWLMLRKGETLPAGDLGGVSLACWAAARMLTENLRLRQIAALPEDFRIAGWAAAAAMALILILWTGRAFRQQKNTGYAFACLPVFGLSVAGIVLIQNGILTGYTPAVDVIAQVCLALMALKAVLCMGRVTRN